MSLLRRLRPAPGLCLGLLLLAVPVRAADTPTGAPPDFTAIIQHAKEELFPKTVYIKTVLESFEEGKKIKEQATGSGVIISSDGYVVTNFHVVDKAVSVRCILLERRQMDATVIGKDEDTDLALLKLKVPQGHPPLPAARFGDSDKLKEGDFVMAMGCPFGLARSVSFGVVSNPRQYIGGWSEYNNWIQTDASVNPGNSGGPLANVSGEVVGINTKAITGTGIGFAIPSSIVQRVLEDLKTSGRVERSWSGLQFQALKDFERNTFVDAEDGVLVGGLDPDSPALASGLKDGDIILSVNGQPLHGIYVEDLPEVRRILASLPAGKPAQLSLLRGSKPLALTLTPRIKGAVEGESYDCEEWMMTLKEINQFYDPWTYHLRKKGCYILGAKANGNADRSGFSPDDILVKIDGVEVDNLEKVKTVYQESLRREPGKRKILFELLRRGLPMKLVLDYNRTKASYEEEK